MENKVLILELFQQFERQPVWEEENTKFNWMKDTHDIW